MISQRATRARRLALFAPSNPSLAIDLAQGLPDPATFAWLPSVAELAATSGIPAPNMLQYAHTLGLPELREALARRLGSRRERILVTNGASQALQLACDAYTEPGDVVLAEDPSYLGALRTFHVAGVDVHQIPLDVRGIDLDGLEAVLHEHRGRVRLLYSCPVSHNPTGRHFSRERMREVAALLARHDALLIQDLVYSETYYDERPATLDAGDNVINVHSMSKVAWPGLRIGWVHAEEDVIHAMAGLKREGGCSALASAIALGLIEWPGFDAHLERLRSHYRSRRDAMQALLADMPLLAHRLPPPEGGFSCWIRLAGGFDAEDLISSLPVDEPRVAVVPGRAHGASGSGFIRVCFSHLQPDRIASGMRALEVARRCTLYPTSSGAAASRATRRAPSSLGDL